MTNTVASFHKDSNRKNQCSERDEKQQIDVSLVKILGLFAKRRFDFGYNSKITMKLRPEHDLPVYIQSPPTPTQISENIRVQLALLQNFGNITSRNRLKYSSLISAHCKPPENFEF